jgi:hypothetical protein
VFQHSSSGVVVEEFRSGFNVIGVIVSGNISNDDAYVSLKKLFGDPLSDLAPAID